MTDATRLSGGPPMRRVLDALRTYGHSIALLGVLLFMFLSRALGYDGYRLADGTLAFRDGDAWYHYRNTVYAVDHWLSLMPFDPWRAYPIGDAATPSGTVVDQAVALVALLIGTGSPSDDLIRHILLFAAPVLAVLVAVPTYFIACRIAGGHRWTGVTAVALLALFPGTFYEVGLIGSSTGSVASVFCLAVAVAVFARAISVAQSELPIWEIIAGRDIGRVRDSVVSAVGAGVATAVLVWSGPESVFFVVVLGVFFLLVSIRAHIRSNIAEPTLFVGAISMSVASLLILTRVVSLTLDPSVLSLFHVALPSGVAVLCVGLIALERRTDQTDASNATYVCGVTGTLVAAAGVSYVLVPELGPYLGRTFGMGFLGSPLDGQSLAAVGGIPSLFGEYGAVITLAGVGGFFVAYRSLSNRSDVPLFLGVWALGVALATATQVQHHQHFAVVVAVLAAYAIQFTLVHINVDWTAPRSVAGHDVLLVVILALLIVPVLLFPLSSSVIGMMGAHDTGDYEQWDDSLDWLGANTPAVGNWASAENELDPYGAYDADAFAYPEGTYGVLSSWEYGPYITVEGDRLPVTNPSYQNAETAARYFLATDEGSAAEALGDTEVRYVMVDWRMTYPEGTLGDVVDMHPTAGGSQYVHPLYMVLSDETETSPMVEYGTYALTQQYYESMAVRLYQHHGSAVEPSPLVVDYEFKSGAGGQDIRALPTDRMLVQQYSSLEAANEAADNDATAHVGGVGPHPREPVTALEHYRLVYASESSAVEASEFVQAVQYNAAMTGLQPHQLLPDHPNWVKTFERVPGATVTGTAPAESTVRASVEMQMPHSERTFTYVAHATADDEGTFELVVPYSTTGEGEWGVDDGYTDSAVLADGPYTFETVVAEPDSDSDAATLTRWATTAHVTEAQVIGENPAAVTVELTEQETESVDGWDGTEDDSVFE